MNRQGRPAARFQIRWLSVGGSVIGTRVFNDAGEAWEMFTFAANTNSDGTVQLIDREMDVTVQE